MTQTTLTVADFVLARIAEDEAVARDRRRSARLAPNRWSDGTLPEDLVGVVLEGRRKTITKEEWIEKWTEPVDPDPRVLAELNAKRRIAELWTDPDAVPRWNRDGHLQVRMAVDRCVRIIASIWRDHPDWREEWSE